MEPEIKRPMKQIWCVYNHLPGGHVVAIHFEDFTRKKRDGDRAVEILISAKDQVEGFKKAPQVALNIKGKVVAREVLIYQGEGTFDVQGRPDAADIVLAWAKEKGVEPIRSAAEAAKDTSPGKVAALENRIEGLEKGQSDILGKLDRILEKTPA